MTVVNDASKSIYTDLNGLAQLRSQAGKPTKGTIKEVAAQFEAVFINMMLKTMRDAKVTDEGLFDSQEGNLYQDMFDKQVSLDMAHGKGIGLADTIIRQLNANMASEEQDPSADSAKPKSMSISRGVAPGAQVAKPEQVSSFSVTTPTEFVQRVWPQAKRAAQALGVQPEFIVAQAALESGWGKNLIRSADGAPTFNFFGIKADSSWQGSKVTVPTLENDPARGLVRQNAAFRSYGSIDAAFDDYVKFLQTNPRYQTALSSVQGKQDFGAALQQAGYATDSAYAAKIDDVLASGRIQQALGAMQVAQE